MRIRDLGAWFQNPAAQCSSHHGADSYERGLFGAYVYENYAAWTQGNANGYCLSIELCGYAEWTRSQWLNERPILVDNAAEWLRYIVDKYGIPWTLLNDSQAQNANARGICQHVNLGSWGSGHWDCGDGFPIDVILDKAKKWGTGQPQPTPPPEEEDEYVISIPPGDGQVAFSFPKYYGQIGFFADVGMFSETAKVQIRMALRHKSGSWYVWNIDLTKAAPKKVITFNKEYDSASFTRLDDLAITVVPNFV